MLLAYVLVETKPSVEHKIYNWLLKTTDEVHPLFGEWDLITKITGETTDEINDKIEKIKNYENIENHKVLKNY